MSLDRLRYEMRLLGRPVVLTPILIVLGFTLLLILVQHNMSASNIRRAIAGSLEVLLPMAAGVIVATVATHDPAIELQLTMPRKYDRTAFGRFLLIFFWMALVSFLTALLLYLLGDQRVPLQIATWNEPWQFLTWQLNWLASNVWLMAVALVLSLLVRSRSASGALVGAFAVIELFAHDDFNHTLWLRPVYLFPLTFSPDADYWLVNRFELIGTALVLFLCGWFLLRLPELLLSHAPGEE
jgi:hypothetical protein